MYTCPLVQAKCCSFNFGSLWGFSPGMWNSDKNPSRKMLVGMTGDVDDEASAGGVGAGLAFGGFALGAEAAASARAFAAASFVPKSSVKSFSSEVLTWPASAHLPNVNELPRMKGETCLRSETLLRIPPSIGPRLVQLSGGEGREERYDISCSGSCSRVISTPWVPSAQPGEA